MNENKTPRAAALLPIFLILLPLELIWRRFSCIYEPIRS